MSRVFCHQRAIYPFVDVSRLQKKIEHGGHGLDGFTQIRYIMSVFIRCICVIRVLTRKCKIISRVYL